jgi:acyl-CoA dehydrogenase
VVFATIDPSLGRAGHRAFVVEKGTPGFEVGKIEDKMGLRANETAELVLEDCRVPEENLLGGEEKYVSKEGFMTAMKTFDNTRPLVGAMASASGAPPTSTRATS